MCHNGMAPRESLETEMEEEAWFPVAQYVCHEEGVTIEVGMVSRGALFKDLRFSAS